MNQQEDYNHLITEFLEMHGLRKIIAFSGGSDTTLAGVPRDDALQTQYKKLWSEYEERVIQQCLGKLRGYNVAILTGGTKWGIPKTATQKAKEFGMKTIGVYPLAGKKHALENELLDLSICVESSYNKSRWGDESPLFAKLLDGVVVFGGGAGTLTECAHILKMNEGLAEGGQLKYVVPISGSGGVADGLPFVWAKPEIRSACMPDSRIKDGFQAADFLVDKLELYDYLKL